MYGGLMTRVKRGPCGVNLVIQGFGSLGETWHFADFIRGCWRCRSKRRRLAWFRDDGVRLAH
jgi:hypothetical protein